MFNSFIHYVHGRTTWARWLLTGFLLLQGVQHLEEGTTDSLHWIALWHCS